MKQALLSAQLPTVHPVYLRLLTDALEDRGHDIDAVLAAAELDRMDIGATAPPVAFRKLLKLLQHVTTVSSDPTLPVSWGKSIKPAAHGTVGTAVFSASTLREALQTWSALLPLRSSAVHFRLTELPGMSRFEFTAMPTMVGLDEFIATVVGFVSIQVLQSLIGPRLSQVRVAFPFPQPNWSDRPEAWCPCEVTFNAKSLHFQIPTEYLDLPCPSADARTHEAAVRQAEIDKLSSRDGLSEKVSAYLAYSPDAYPTLAEVATRFHMSSRTLRRQLQGEGLSFQVLLDRVRMDSARHFLTETDLTIQQITERLGYGDPSNFIRAFRRHHGCTPGQYRANTN